MEARPRPLRLRLLAPLVGVLALGPPAAAVTADEVEQCMRDNLPSTTSIQRVRFKSADRTGDGRLIEGKMWWRLFEKGRSRALYRVLSPPDLRGSAVLAIEREGGSDLFSFLPELKKVRRITSHSLQGSLFGSDFTYEDFQYLQGMRGGVASELVQDSATADRAWALATAPDPESGSAYVRVVSYVDRERCLPLRTEFFEAGERLRKVMSIDPEQVHEENGARIPLYVEMVDRVLESRTELEVLEVEIGAKIRRGVFELNALERSKLD